MEYVNIKSPNKVESEDAYVINEKRKIYGVFDGATPLTSFKDEAGHNGAYLAANLFREYFEQLDDKEGPSLVEGVIKANDLLRRKMEVHQIDTTKKHHLWSTCVALVQINADSVEYAQLGDCIIIAGYKDGRIAVLTKNTVKNISERAREKRNRDRQNSLEIPAEESFRNHQNSLIYNRSMANTPEGYSVANGMPEVKEFIQTGTIKLEDLAYLLILTDGLFFPGKTLEFTLGRVKEIGLKEYAEQLSRVLMERQIRMDDMTAILLKF